jgi:hypothetical protein
VCEAPTESRWKSGSGSENGLLGVVRRGSVLERMGLAVREVAERNWSCAC